MARANGQRVKIDGVPMCYVDASGNVSMVIKLRRAWVNNGKRKGYERRASAPWPGIGKVQLRGEYADFLQEKSDELDKLDPALVAAQPAPVAAPMTLLEAVPKFIKRAYGGAKVDADGTFISGSARARDVTKFMAYWCQATDDESKPVFGARALDSIEPGAITEVLNTWKAKGMKPWTAHHRRTALSHCFSTVNGKSGFNPVRDTKWLKPKDKDARGFDYEYVDAILAEVPDYVWQNKPKAGELLKHGPVCKAKIMLRIWCSTGLGPAEINRIEPRHLNLKKEELYTWRHKAGVISGERTIDLIPDAVAAFKVFVANNWFSRERDGHTYNAIDASTVAKAWKVALKKAQAKWVAKHGEPMPLPKRCRPTDLRHCYGSLVFKTTGDREVTAEIIGHVPGSPQTARYTQSEVRQVVRKATAKVSKVKLFSRPQPSAL